MKNDDSILSRIEIAKPCSADWESMTGDERERTCQLCQLNVFNIAEMTKTEAESFLAERIPQGRVCIRIFRRQDGTIITDDCPRGLRAARDAARRLKQRVAAAASLVLTFLAPAAGLAQGGDDKKKETSAPVGRMGDVAMPKNKGNVELMPTAGKPSVNALRGEATIKPPVSSMMGGVCPMPADMPAYMAKVHDKVKLPADLFKGAAADDKSKLKVTFQIKADGSINDLKVSSSSGDQKVDAKVLQAVKKAAPFAKLPPMQAAPYNAEYTP